MIKGIEHGFCYGGCVSGGSEDAMSASDLSRRAGAVRRDWGNVHTLAFANAVGKPPHREGRTKTLTLLFQEYGFSTKPRKRTSSSIFSSPVSFSSA